MKMIIKGLLLSGIIVLMQTNTSHALIITKDVLTEDQQEAVYNMLQSECEAKNIDLKLYEIDGIMQNGYPGAHSGLHGKPAMMRFIVNNPEVVAIAVRFFRANDLSRKKSFETSLKISLMIEFNKAFYKLIVHKGTGTLDDSREEEPAMREEARPEEREEMGASTTAPDTFEPDSRKKEADAAIVSEERDAKRRETDLEASRAKTMRDSDSSPAARESSDDERPLSFAERRARFSGGSKPMPSQKRNAPASSWSQE